MALSSAGTPAATSNSRGAASGEAAHASCSRSRARLRKAKARRGARLDSSLGWSRPRGRSGDIPARWSTSDHVSSEALRSGCPVYGIDPPRFHRCGQLVMLGTLLDLIAAKGEPHGSFVTADPLHSAGGNDVVSLVEVVH